jgi:FMN phosphatase YigB (HAD superfamily)
MQTPITHIFFDLHGTLVDPALMSPCYAASLGDLMADTFGGDPAAWAAANRRILADWDSYYTDLDLGGDDAMHDMWEGLFRTTRALFRLTGTPEPDHESLIRLSRELPGMVTRNCAVFYPDVVPALETLHRAGFILATASTVIQAQVRGTLEGGGVLDRFRGPLFGADLTERFVKDSDYYLILARHVGAAPQSCLVVDDQAQYLYEAREAGWQVAHMARSGAADFTQPPVDWVCTSMDALVRILVS